MSDSIFLELKNVSKTYKTKNSSLSVIRNVSLKIKGGTFTAIVGPSGAGKSTLLYLMGLLLDLDIGDILINNINVSSLSDKKKSFIRNSEIGFIFQNYHLLPEFTALENIILPLYLKGTSYSKSKDKAITLLNEVNLLNRKDHRPSELSGGEQQRICICRALINEPKIILADEPTGNLDSNNSLIVMKLLEKLYKVHGASLIVVTHNESISKESDILLHMEDGSVL